MLSEREYMNETERVAAEACETERAKRRQEAADALKARVRPHIKNRTQGMASLTEKEKKLLGDLYFGRRKPWKTVEVSDATISRIDKTTFVAAWVLVGAMLLFSVGLFALGVGGVL